MNVKLRKLLIILSSVSVLSTSVYASDLETAYTNSKIDISKEVEHVDNKGVTVLNSIKEMKYSSLIDRILNKINKLGKDKEINNLVSEESILSKDYILSQNISEKKSTKLIDSLSEMKNISNYVEKTFNKASIDAQKIVYEVYLNAFRKDLKPELILGLIEVESSFNHEVVLKNQHGLMQIIPRYHPEEIQDLKDKDLKLTSIEGNVETGVKILDKYRSLYKGNIVTALQQYNGALNDSKKSYSNKVLTKMKKYEKISSFS